jgi:hypothetical protein
MFIVFEFQYVIKKFMQPPFVESIYAQWTILFGEY